MEPKRLTPRGLDGPNLTSPSPKRPTYMQDSKTKILDRVKDLKDHEIVDGATTMAADYLEDESQGLFARIQKAILDQVDEWIDKAPRRLRWLITLLGLRAWLKRTLVSLQEDGIKRAAKELRDFSQPE